MQRLVFIVVMTGALLGAACSSSAPSPEIVGATARDGSPNLDYTVYVDCTVRNNGRDGDIEVVATLTGGGQWRKRATTHVSKGEERLVTIAFPEPEFLAAGLQGFRYGCSAERG